MTPAIDGSRLIGRLAELSAIGAAGDGGVTRLAWSPDDRRAVALVGEWASAAGAAVRVDAAGSLLAEWPGAVAGLAPIAMGSHLDTVVSAGALDGAYGVVAGVEVLAALAAAGARLRHPLRVAAFANEEGVVAPPFTGSRVAAGLDIDAELAVPGGDGVALADRISRAGGDAGALAGAAWSALAGYLELHIEQGPVLDAAGRRAGIVTAITGQHRAHVEITGRANHAGTTPMEMRHDALAAAAHAVLAVEALALSGPADVATVGRFEVEPGVSNVVAGRVDFSVDVRSVDARRGAAAIADLRRRLEEIADTTATAITLFPTSSSSPVETDRRWRDVLRRAAESCGVEAIDMASGAGHDAQHIASLAPAGVLFVPSIDGVSHHPAERTADADLVLGARIALEALLAADRQLDA